MSAAPDLVARVIGFRKWRVRGDHLSSPYMSLRWDEPVLHAECLPGDSGAVDDGWLREPHDAPHPECRCGIYAYHDPPRRGPIPDYGRTFGIVALWGRIAVHRDGMRAQHAEIVALAYCAELGSRHRAAIGTIARELAVPVVEHNLLRAVASEFGDPLPSALLPEPQRPWQRRADAA